ncbi:MAG TPA: response regulator [Bryobacteraceae bacterium]|nr:response regulator [Bryobacteraceae bacterium]
MVEFFSKLLSSDFMPHKMCFLENQTVLWLSVTSDGLIALAYYLIPFLLFYFSRKRRDVGFHWIFVAFGVFILACGTSHLLGVVTVWNPVYRLESTVKAITGIASIGTFLLFCRIMPGLVRIPSPAQLEAEIEERRAAEAEILQINTELEGRVAGRTAELVESESMYRKLAEEKELAAESLAAANVELQREMKRRQDVEGQLLQAQKMEAIGRLAGGIAHDFNNLLTVILGYNEMLREHVREDAVAFDYTLEVLQAGERASALTNQLLAFSRRQVSIPRVIDLNDLVQNIDKMLRRIIGEDIDLHLKLADGLSSVTVDPSHIDQVIMNLAVNSRDAMPDGGALTIETANVEMTEEYAGSHLGIAPGPYVMLAVSDTGTGMDEATKSRIFEPFFTTKEKGKGTGLGLSIVYGIVKQSGGEVMVYSEPGHGTAFKIYFPVVAEAAGEITGPVEAAPVAGTETILLVEDEHQVRGLTRSMLMRHGYRILDASSGPEALALVSDMDISIDLILTDIVMPQMNGLELAQQITAARPGIKVLFMSGYTDDAVVRQGFLKAETPFIQKPFTSATLQAKVREALGG